MSIRFLLLSPSLGDNCESAGFCRDESLLDIGYEHTLFGNTRQMWEIANWREVNVGFRANGFAFDLQADAAGLPTRDIYINWYNRTDVRWQYDKKRAGAICVFPMACRILTPLMACNYGRTIW